MKFIFFSVNTFKKSGGGLIRMTGIMNELADQGHEIIFISNINKENHSSLDQKIQLVNIDYIFSEFEKRLFQWMLAFFPHYILNFYFKDFLDKMSLISKTYFQKNKIYFFEYLDNSIGYWFYKNGLINGYVNDLHGIVPLEFIFQAKTVNNFIKKIILYLKYISSVLLDRKVFNDASGLIFASNAMKDYLVTRHPKILDKKNYILPYLLSNGTNKKNKILKNNLIKKYSLTQKVKIILFSGVFKRTGGVPDLIKAFYKVSKNYNSAKLMLIGDGYTYKECNYLVNKYNLNNKVIFVGRIDYCDLSTYQDIADIIVCPDRMNIYSDLIIHVKYLDALKSGKIVINGSFKSVLEINENETLSLNFTPSNIKSLAKTLDMSLKKSDSLKIKFRKNKKIVTEKLTYRSYINVLLN